MLIYKQEEMAQFRYSPYESKEIQRNTYIISKILLKYRAKHRILHVRIRLIVLVMFIYLPFTIIWGMIFYRRVINIIA